MHPKGPGCLESPEKLPSGYLINGIRPDEVGTFRIYFCVTWRLPSLVEVDWHLVSAGRCGICGSDKVWFRESGILVTPSPFRVFVHVSCEHDHYFYVPMYWLWFRKVVLRNRRLTARLADIIEAGLDWKIPLYEIGKALPDDIIARRMERLHEMIVAKRKTAGCAAHSARLKEVDQKNSHWWIGPGAAPAECFTLPSYAKEVDTTVSRDSGGQCAQADQAELVRAALQLRRDYFSGVHWL
jgi:hypothetical protein